VQHRQQLYVHGLTCHEAQKNSGIYTGIVGILAQDQAIAESIGPITDHDVENLGPSDIMIGLSMVF